MGCFNAMHRSDYVSGERRPEVLDVPAVTGPLRQSSVHRCHAGRVPVRPRRRRVCRGLSSPLPVSATQGAKIKCISWALDRCAGFSTIKQLHTCSTPRAWYMVQCARGCDYSATFDVREVSSSSLACFRVPACIHMAHSNLQITFFATLDFRWFRSA